REGAETREPAGDTREPTGDTRDSPGSAREPIGSGSGGDRCPKCDEIYRCTVSEGILSQEIELKFTSHKDGPCTVAPLNALLRCDGTFVPTSRNGVSFRWSHYGNGGFVTTTQGLTLTCLPAASISSSDSTPSSPGSGG